MNLRTIAGALLVLASGVSGAQDTRQNAIWEAYTSRVIQQVDRWFDDGDFPRCIQILRVNHELNPADYETTTDLGWMLGNIEKPDEELTIYISYRKAYPTLPDAALPEATFYFLKKMYERIPAIVEPKLAMKPHPNNFRILAHAYEKTGQLKKSKETWEMYIKLQPSDETAKNNLNRVVKALEKKTN